MLSRVTFAAVLALAATACIEPPPAPTSRDNLSPQPALRTPVFAEVGEPETLDASNSFDPDADPLTYVFAVNGVDAVESIEPVIEYTFPSPGIYTVTVRVIDIKGGEGLALQDVTAILNYPDPPDFCSATLRCTVGDECADGICYSTGGALE